MEELGLDSIMDEDAKLCPVCGSNYVCLVRICVTLGGESIEITGGHTHIEKTHVESSNVRGAILAREYACEGSHHWKETEQFHKGCTYIQTEQLGTDGMDYGVLWRD